MNSPNFYENLTSFLETLASPFITTPDGLFFLEKQLLIVPLYINNHDFKNNFPYQQDKVRTIFLWEDVWIRKNRLVQMRLTGEIKGRSPIFARNCTLKTVTKQEADLFFEDNHLLGSANALYRYALFHDEVMVAVGAFSSMRIIQRGTKLCRSAEWVRYATLPHITVTGGMGKVLCAFVAEHHPDDVMSYADKEWSVGASYTKLGFERVGETPVQAYWIDPDTMVRYPQKRHPIPLPHWSLVHGMGSYKYVKTFYF